MKMTFQSVNSLRKEICIEQAKNIISVWDCLLTPAKCLLVHCKNVMLAIIRDTDVLILL